MAYVDLISTGLTPVVGGSTYNFSYDTPIAADGSPHLTHIGFQVDIKTLLPHTLTSTVGRLISSYRIKVGSTEVINFDDPFSNPDGTTPGNLSMMCQKVGGIDACQAPAPTSILGELTLPFGLSATTSHRVNISITLADESSWMAQPLIPATTEFNMVHYYGKASDATLYGSRQDFTLTNGATRNIVVYGKKNWQMLGVQAINDSDADEISEVRVNNGAFRALTTGQWRVLDSTYSKGIRSDSGATSPSWVLARAGYLFLDLKRITAGANIEMSVTSSGDTTYSFMPIWVSPIGQKAAQPPKQNQGSTTSTAKSVESESNY